MSRASYNFGRFLGQQRYLVALCIVLGFGGLLWLEKQRQVEAAQRAAEAQKVEERRRATEAQAEKARLAKLAAACSKGGAFHVQAEKELKAGRAGDALETLQKCGDNLDAPEVKAVHMRATEVSRQRQEAEAKRIAAAEKAAKKRQGVRIGMTQQDVLDSSWGRPERVNRTTNAYGTSEQWVYGSGSYLYFENGILTTVQH